MKQLSLIFSIHLINYPQLINLNTNELKNLLLIKNNIPKNLLSHDNKCNLFIMQAENNKIIMKT